MTYLILTAALLGLPSAWGQTLLNLLTGSDPHRLSRAADQDVAQGPGQTREWSAECRGKGTGQDREFVLERPAPDAPWRLRYRDAGHPGWIRLALPGARPVLANGAADLSFKNANGGRQVTLTIRPGNSHIDVFVDYGLDVNIEPDLDPDVDRMNTDGPLALTCAVTVK